MRKYYVCPACGRGMSVKKIEAERMKSCICGEEIDRGRAGLPELDKEQHFRCAYCGTDNIIRSERTPPSYTVKCKACGRKIAQIHKYAPLVYGARA